MSDAFQPVLSDPNLTSASEVETPGPALPVAGTIIEGIGDVFDVLGRRPLKKVEDTNKIQNVADLTSELQGELGLISGQNIGGVVRGAAEEIDQLRQAYAQGGINQTGVNARLASIVQRYIATDPRNADAYRDLAKNVLGVVPTEQLYAERKATAEEQRKREQEVSNKFQNYAIEQGVAFYDERGNLDQEATALAGQQFAKQQAEFANLKQRIDLEKARAEASAARKLSEAEYKRVEFKQAVTAFEPLYDQVVAGKIRDLHAMAIQARANGSDTTKLEGQLSLLKTQWDGLFAQAVLDTGVSPDTRKELEYAYNAKFGAIESLFVGDFSSLEADKRAFEALEARTSLEMAKAAPAWAATKQLYGQQGVAHIVNQYLANVPGAERGVTDALDEAVKALNARGAVNAQPLADRTAQVQDLSAEDRNRAVKVSLSNIRGTASSAVPIDQRGGEDYAKDYNLSIDVLNTARNPESRRKAVDALIPAAQLNILDRLKEQGNMEAEAAGVRLRDATIQAFYDGVKSNAKGASGSVPGRVTARGEQSTMSVDFVAAYDPQVGRVVVKSVGKKGLSSAHTDRAPEGFKAEVERLNRHLDAVVRLAGYGNSALADLSPEDIRQTVLVGAPNLLLVEDDNALPAAAE